MTPSRLPRSLRPAREPSGPESVTRIVERSAGGVVVRMRQGHHHLLLIRDPYRKWGLPKGHLEEDETSEAAAIREVREETGLTDVRIGPELGEIDWTFRARGRIVHKFCRFFLMEAVSGELQPEVSEGITECRWLPVAEAIEAVGYENAREILQIAAGRLISPEELSEGRLWRDPEGEVDGGSPR